MDAPLIEKEVSGGQFNWRLPFYGVLGALVIFVPIEICNFDLFLLLFIVGLILLLVSVLVLIKSEAHKKWHRFLATMSMLTILWGTWVLLVADDITTEQPIHTAARWLARSGRYKAEVLAQPQPLNGEYKHIEWNAWGFPGAGDTVVYLIFDPTDSLALPAKTHQSGKFNGVPCEVPLVHRLESQWYTVRFYTEEDWRRCN